MGYLMLARPYQWYKNLVIFLAIYFSGQFFNLDGIILTIIGFFALCLVSSANYVINDLIDKNDDKKHPEKKHRAIASGEISSFNAYFYGIFLLILSFIIAYFINYLFLFCVAALFGITLIYSVWGKNQPILDIIFIGVNFVIRAISGALIIDVTISPWLILCTFFLALLLASGKRKGEIMLLGKSAEKNKRLKPYINLADSLISINATVLIVAYSLYSFLRHPLLFIATLPFFMYAVFNYLLITKQNPKIARKPHLLIIDKHMAIAILIILIIITGVLYA